MRVGDLRYKSFLTPEPLQGSYPKKTVVCHRQAVGNLWDVAFDLLSTLEVLGFSEAFPMPMPSNVLGLKQKRRCKPQYRFRRILVGRGRESLRRDEMRETSRVNARCSSCGIFPSQCIFRGVFIFSCNAHGCFPVTDFRVCLHI